MGNSVKYLKDYREPAHWIRSVDLVFDIPDPLRILEGVKVVSVLKIEPNIKYRSSTLVLQGENVTLVSVVLNSQVLEASDYQLDAYTLTLSVPLEPFTLTIETLIYPAENTALSGLYYTNNNYCTQCEPEGFRRITYYLDRPDVLAVFTTTILAHKEPYPYLLSNGNIKDQGDINNHHWVTWHDPFPKPCYLFALVAGDFACIKDSYLTKSQKTVPLFFYVDPAFQHKVGHALQSLKKAMKWDEDTYGLEYDLEQYRVVAVSDFNMGAMENKGLNIFNTKYVLADEKTATDLDYLNIEAVIGHEYFHNWSGNRVTCRDWFQLSLKEGFTVFREHQFSAFCGSPAVARIDEANLMRTRQFAEDASPLAHPVRPESYIEMNNFYTLTVYHKGAEVIRMLKTWVGEVNFYKGVALYFKRHDGQAVTCDDFLQAIADVSLMDTGIKIFKRWYSQAGTPSVQVTSTHDAMQQTFTLHCQQSSPPMLIPMDTALFDQNGSFIESRILILQETEQSFVFEGISEKPIPSLFRSFSAPVLYHYQYTLEERLQLLKHESDLFNQWDVAQQLLVDCLIKPTNALNESMIGDALISLLENNTTDEAWLSRVFTLPSLAYLMGKSTTTAPIDLDQLVIRLQQLETKLAETLETVFLTQYQNPCETIGQRALKNTCLYYLVRANPVHDALAEAQYRSATNMTLKLGALQAINDLDLHLRSDLLTDFYTEFQSDPLVLDKWFALQARANRTTVLQEVLELTQHADFSFHNPNKVYALISGFTTNCPAFHEKSGQGYHFLQTIILKLDPLNPQVAARLANAFADKHLYDPIRQTKINNTLQHMLTHKLSSDVFEILQKILVNDTLPYS